jgi:hypothetical protein
MAAGISTAKAKAKPGGLKESILEGALGGLLKAGNYAANPERPTGKLFAAGLVPASAALAGLGGVAAGAIPGSMGVPGFQQQVVDPESYGSSNSPGARYKAPTMQYV